MEKKVIPKIAFLWDLISVILFLLMKKYSCADMEVALVVNEPDIVGRWL